MDFPIENTIIARLAEMRESDTDVVLLFVWMILQQKSRYCSAYFSKFNNSGKMLPMQGKSKGLGNTLHLGFGQSGDTVYRSRGTLLKMLSLMSSVVANANSTTLKL